MGRTQLIAKYEITPQIKELQRLAMAVKGIGIEVNIDITQDLVTINGFRKLNREQAKAYLVEALESNKNALTTQDYPDQEEIAKEEKRKAKEAKKHREPGAPPELKALIRRAKRIHKKALAKGLDNNDALAKAYKYVDSKSTPDNIDQAKLTLSEYFAKEQ